MEITKEEASQLLKFLQNQYVSHEDYFLIHLLIKKLRKWVDEE